MAQTCCQAKKVSADDAFLTEANKMMLASEGKKACCKTTAKVAVAKAEKGCCNEKGELAKFKVFVSGKGYAFFGCPDSAAQGRKAAIAKGAKTGPVQAVSGRVAL